MVFSSALVADTFKLRLLFNISGSDAQMWQNSVAKIIKMPDISYFRTIYIVMHHIGDKARRPHGMDDKLLFRLAVAYGMKRLYSFVEILWRIGFIHEAALNEENIPDNVEWQE